MTGREFERGFRKEGVAVSTSLSLSFSLSLSLSFVTFAESRVVFTSANNERCTRNFLSLFPFHLFFIHLPGSPFAPRAHRASDDISRPGNATCTLSAIGALTSAAAYTHTRARAKRLFIRYRYTTCRCPLAFSLLFAQISDLPELISSHDPGSALLLQGRLFRSEHELDGGASFVEKYCGFRGGVDIIPSFARKGIIFTGEGRG